MKKIIVFILIIVLAFLGIFMYLNREIDLKVANELGTNLCESTISDIEGLNSTFSQDYSGNEKAQNMINALCVSEDEYINLDEYFADFLIDYKEDEIVGNPEGYENEIVSNPEGFEPESNYIEPIVNDIFQEEPTIYKDSNGNRCIKVNDLRIASSGEALVNFHDGEYIIAVKDIPVTYTRLVNENYFDFNLYSVDKVDKNVYEFLYVNNSTDFSTKLLFTIEFNAEEIVDYTMSIIGFNPIKGE